MKSEEQTNISAFMLDCLEKELGHLEKINGLIAPLKPSN
jgi:hypothetical protein|tara:strand:+ start:377 stop:493 length:117 start_codon:yes stop_codon:yes gene_type:complete